MTALARVGIDQRGENLLVARVVESSGRPSVESLLSIPCDELAGQSVLVGARAVFAVPDNEVMTKWLHVPRAEGLDAGQLCRFELSHSLLEPKDQFLFDVIPTGAERKYLGLTYRKERLAVLDDCFGLGHTGGYSELDYRARAVGLGQGYLHFCRPEAGELIGLVDFAGRFCSICLVYRRNLVSLGHLPVRPGDLGDASSARRLAIECRTVINLKLSSLASEGVAVPLAMLLVSGAEEGSPVRDAFAEYFTTGVAVPRINESYLAESADRDLPLDAFLVALGLTVN